MDTGTSTVPPVVFTVPTVMTSCTCALAATATQRIAADKRQLRVERRFISMFLRRLPWTGRPRIERGAGDVQQAVCNGRFAHACRVAEHRERRIDFNRHCLR